MCFQVRQGFPPLQIQNAHTYRLYIWMACQGSISVERKNCVLWHRFVKHFHTVCCQGDKFHRVCIGLKWL